MAKLYVIATPIGNLSDLSPRAGDALRECDLVCAEDTRVSVKLLSVLGISKPMLSCHRHNEDERADGVIERMIRDDLTVALVSDAGTPAISDPGQFIVDAAWEAGVEVIPIPGPSATVTALSASGFDARSFTFYGFLPRENKPLVEALKQIAKRGPGAAVLYESPHRVVNLVSRIAEVMPENRTLVCCDLTKKFEKILRGTAGELLEKLRANPNVEKGEYAVVIELGEPPEEKETPKLTCELAILDRMLAGADINEACAALSDRYPRNELYRATLRVKKRFD